MASNKNIAATFRAAKPFLWAGDKEVRCMFLLPANSTCPRESIALAVIEAKERGLL